MHQMGAALFAGNQMGQVTVFNNLVPRDLAQKLAGQQYVDDPVTGFRGRMDKHPAYAGTVKDLNAYYESLNRHPMKEQPSEQLNALMDQTATRYMQALLQMSPKTGGEMYRIDQLVRAGVGKGEIKPADAHRTLGMEYASSPVFNDAEKEALLDYELLRDLRANLPASPSPQQIAQGIENFRDFTLQREFDNQLAEAKHKNKTHGAAGFFGGYVAGTAGLAAISSAVESIKPGMINALEKTTLGKLLFVGALGTVVASGIWSAKMTIHHFNEKFDQNIPNLIPQKAQESLQRRQQQLPAFGP